MSDVDLSQQGNDRPRRGRGGRWVAALSMLAASTALIALAAVLAVSSAGAQGEDGADVFDTSGLRGFIKFDGVEGGSQEIDHIGWSDLATFDQALLTPAVSQGAGRAAVGPTFEEILVGKSLDKTGPKLQEAVAKGTVFPVVSIDLVRVSSGDRNVVFYSIELKDVRVTSYNVGTTGQVELTPSGLPRIASGGPTLLHSWPVDEVSLAFEEIKVTYHEIDEQGRPGGETVFAWDLTRDR